MNNNNVLYIGSGRSAELVAKLDISHYIVVCANNAWRLFEDSKFDFWLHSGDFPRESRPATQNFDHEISYAEYSVSMSNIVNKLNLQCKSPQHYLGYTVFFNGLYWILDVLQPQTIFLLGFDHDYNVEKIKKWEENKRPSPQNSFFRQADQTITNWSEEFFSGMEHDSFYGHGTPDPLRLGMSHLKSKMHQALKNADLLGTQIINLSPVESEFNKIIPKIKIK
jgi:hypothetical protein